ncbi:helix-turn-helix transcriptional regulator [Pendulispora brunnea]|uniref:Helix-turn-helix transcriptional regulator n=1 Tax=Pendulispora brunnea TaxID=2905690 RepID=A0ABZ2KJF0_9BACT
MRNPAFSLVDQFEDIATDSNKHPLWSMMMLTSPTTIDEVRLRIVECCVRRDFSGHMLEALRTLVPSAGAFLLLSGIAGTVSPRSTRVVDGSELRPTIPSSATLSEALGIAVDVALMRKAHIHFHPELYRSSSSYFLVNSLPNRFVRAISMWLHDGTALHGVCGLERREDEPAFTQADVGKLELLIPFIVAITQTRLVHDALEEEIAALRSTTVHSAFGDPKPIHVVYPSTRAGKRESIGQSKQGTTGNLSRREREIARHLVAGYSVVNIAAILGLSENTIRTYVRRVYTKLEVSNRAEMVRQFPY